MDQAQALLKRCFGYDAFRPGQREIIERIGNGEDVLAVMPTGAGKSVCYQIPAMLSRGVTIVVSPLISLMKDQVDALTQAGIPAAYLNSSLSPAQQDAAMERAENGAYKIIYAAPERLESERFRAWLMRLDIPLVAVDEAHCVSQWGHDFRPSYTKIADAVAALPSRPVVAAFTATATPRVKEDIVRLLGLRRPFLLTTGFDRPNLYFAVEKPKSKTDALLRTLQTKKDRSGIVYAATRKTVDTLCARLRGAGISAVRYHAGLPEAERVKNQEDFLYDRAGVMVATNAFGMGIDKSNISFVLHYNMPQSLESYYQEAGRAGRDGEKAECVLFYSAADIVTDRLLIENGADEGGRAASLQKLRDMVDYCNTDGCLRAFILRYFGETDAPQACGNCGSCNSQTERTDITTEAQKILSCVVRMGGRFGSGTVTEVLRGGQTRKIKELGFEQLSTFGIMKEYSVETVKEIISFLVADRYLELCGEKYPVLRPAPAAREVLRGQKPVFIRRVLRKQETGAPGAPADEALFSLLRGVRAELAQEEGVPPFVVFSDATLREMCQKYPGDAESLLQISGVGSVKLEKFGGRFLEAIRAYANEHGIPLAQGGFASAPDAVSAEKRRKPPGAPGDSMLESYRLCQSGQSIAEIAKTRGLAPSTVESHLLACLQSGMDIPGNLFATPDEERQIREAIRQCGRGRLAPIKAALPESIGYGAIRYVLYKYRPE